MENVGFVHPDPRTPNHHALKEKMNANVTSNNTLYTLTIKGPLLSLPLHTFPPSLTFTSINSSTPIVLGRGSSRDKAFLCSIQGL